MKGKIKWCGLYDIPTSKKNPSNCEDYKEYEGFRYNCNECGHCKIIIMKNNEIIAEKFFKSFFESGNTDKVFKKLTQSDVNNVMVAYASAVKPDRALTINEIKIWYDDLIRNDDAANAASIYVILNIFQRHISSLPTEPEKKPDREELIRFAKTAFLPTYSPLNPEGIVDEYLKSSPEPKEKEL